MSAIESTFETFFSFFSTSSSDEQRSLVELSKEIDRKLYSKSAKQPRIIEKNRAIWHPLPDQSDAVKTMKYMGLQPTDF
jgi:hypothetical protein